MQQKQSTDGSLVSRRDYVGQFEFVADTLERTLLPEGFITESDGTFHAFIPDHQGNITGVYNSATNALEQFTDYYPYGLPHASATSPEANRRKYGAKELTTDLGLNLYDFVARFQNPAFPHFTTPDPLAEDFTPISVYSYCASDPVNLVDPTGKNPVYDIEGNFLGCTTEGFTGMIMIYTGSDNIDPTQFTLSELENSAGTDLVTYDDARKSTEINMNQEAHSQIWTHVASHFEGTRIYDEVFSMKSIRYNKIGYETRPDDSWSTAFQMDPNGLPPKIVGTGNYTYESTVENIASSIIVHEWYSHGKKHTSNKYKSHRLAYENVIKYKQLWNKTTDRYKAFYLEMLLYLTIKETSRKTLPVKYRSLYKKYVH